MELQEIIEFLKDPQKFTRLGGRLPKGALLVGPPGTGKTLLAKAVAGEAGRPFFSMSGSDFVEMFVGVGASRVRDLFEQGKSARALHHLHRRDRRGRPASRRRARRRSRRARADAQPAARRDGRLRVERRRHPHRRHQPARRARSGAAAPGPLRPPDRGRRAGRARAARGSSGCTRGRSRSRPTCGSSTIAKGTPGMAGADLANLVNEAALLAARRNKTLVDMEDFEDAKDKVMLGVERRSLVLTEDGAEAHRLSRGGPRARGAARCRAAIRCTRSRSCRAAARSASPPRCPRTTGTTTRKDWLIGSLAMFFGGRVAEEIVFGADKVTTGAGNDIERATDARAPDGHAVRHERASSARSPSATRSRRSSSAASSPSGGRSPSAPRRWWTTR